MDLRHILQSSRTGVRRKTLADPVPISNHLRIVPDYCYWRGLFVMGGDQTDSSWDSRKRDSGLVR